RVEPPQAELLRPAVQALHLLPGDRERPRAGRVPGEHLLLERHELVLDEPRDEVLQHLVFLRQGEQHGERLLIRQSRAARGRYVPVNCGCRRSLLAFTPSLKSLVPRSTCCSNASRSVAARNAGTRSSLTVCRAACSASGAICASSAAISCATARTLSCSTRRSARPSECASSPGRRRPV